MLGPGIHSVGGFDGFGLDSCEVIKVDGEGLEQGDLETAAGDGEDCLP